MKRSRTLIICWAAWFSSSAALAQPASDTQPATPQRDPQAVKILKEACDLLRKQRAFSTVCTVRRIEGDEKSGRILDLRGELTFARPNWLKVVSDRPRWRLDGKPLEGDHGLAVSDAFCDGRKIDYVMPTLETYVRHPAPQKVSEVFEQGAFPDYFNFPGIMVFPVFLTDDPYEIMAGGQWAIDYLGRDKLDGTDCHVIRQRTSGVVDLNIWIDAETHLFRQFATDTSRAVAEHMQVVAPAFITRFTEWKLDPPLRQADFEYTPPPHFKKSDVLRTQPPEPPSLGSAPATRPASSQPAR